MKFLQESLDNRLLLKPFIEKESKGGIILAIDNRSQAINTDRGEVYMIGPNCWEDAPKKPDIKVGDKVYYSHYGAKVIKPEDQEDFFIVCNDRDILAGYSDE